jgi:hypothetical protein
MSLMSLVGWRKPNLEEQRRLKEMSETQETSFKRILREHDPAAESRFGRS